MSISSSKVEALNKAYKNGWISSDEFENKQNEWGIKSSDNSNVQPLKEDKENSRLKAIERANEKGWISPEEYERLRPPIENKKEDEESFLKKSGRSLARGARNALAGTVDTLDFLASPVRAGLNLGSKALGSNYEFRPVAEDVTKSIDTLTGGLTAPQNDKEKTEEAIHRAIGSIPIGFGVGTMANSLKYAPKIVESIGKFLKGANKLSPSNVAASGATSGLIQSHLNENPEDSLGAIGAGLSVPVAQSALGLLTKRGRQGAAAKTGEFFKVNPEAVETFEKAGITPTLPDVSSGKISKMLTHRLEHIPFAGHHIKEAKELQKNQILEGLGQGEFGKILSKGEAGKLTSKGAKQYQKSENKKFYGMSKKFDKDIQKLSKSGEDLVASKSVDDFFEKEIFSKFKDPLQEKLFKESEIGKQYQTFHEAAKKNNGKLPYYAMKSMLDSIRNKVTTFGTIGDLDQGQLKRFSTQIMNDIERDLGPKLKRLGKDSYNNWKKFRKDYSEYKQEVIPKLNEIYKKDKKSGTDAFIDLMTSHKKGGEKPNIVLKGLSPDEQIELTDAVHKQLGRKQDGTFSPLKWSREFKGLEPDSQKILLSPLNESSQKKISYIADTMDHLKSTLEEANSSKSGYYVALDKVLHQIPTAIVGLASTGNPLPAASLAGGLFVSKLASDKLLTNPRFINWMHKGMKAKNLNQFEKILNNVPNVGKYRKTLQREVQTFQHDLDNAKKEKDNLRE